MNIEQRHELIGRIFTLGVNTEDDNITLAPRINMTCMLALLDDLIMAPEIGYDPEANAIALQWKVDEKSLYRLLCMPRNHDIIFCWQHLSTDQNAQETSTEFSLKDLNHIKYVNSELIELSIKTFPEIRAVWEVKHPFHMDCTPGEMCDGCPRICARRFR